MYLRAVRHRASLREAAAPTVQFAALFGECRGWRESG